MTKICVAVVALTCWAGQQNEARSPGYAAYEKANALFVGKKFPECAAAIDEALKLDPKLVPALTLKTKLEMALNRFDVARQSVEQALVLEPGSAYVQFLAGFEAYLENNLTTALQRLKRARQLNASDPRAALYLGLTRESLGQSEEALSLYREAARLEKSAGTQQTGTLLIGARLMLLSDRLDECQGWLQEAVALEPGSRDAHFEMARLFLKKGNAAQAVSEGELALRLPLGEVKDAQVHYLLIRAYRASSDTNRADEHAAAVRALEKL